MSVSDGRDSTEHRIEILFFDRWEAERLYDRLEQCEALMMSGGTLSLCSYPDARVRSASNARVIEAARELVQSKRFPRTTGEILADHYSLVEALAGYDAALAAAAERERELRNG